MFAFKAIIKLDYRCSGHQHPGDDEACPHLRNRYHAQLLSTVKPMCKVGSAMIPETAVHGLTPGSACSVVLHWPPLAVKCLDAHVQNLILGML